GGASRSGAVQRWRHLLLTAATPRVASGVFVGCECLKSQFCQKVPCRLAQARHSNLRCVLL
ncbi:hypothetical protein Dimus_006169, partial [Dionaea muscipula]